MKKKTLEIFEKMKDLYKNDKEEFERERQRLLQKCIDEEITPRNKKKCEQLIWVNNAKSTSIKNELVRAEKGYNVMLDFFFQLNDLITKHNIVINGKKK